MRSATVEWRALAEERVEPAREVERSDALLERLAEPYRFLEKAQKGMMEQWTRRRSER